VDARARALVSGASARSGAGPPAESPLPDSNRRPLPYHLDAPFSVVFRLLRRVTLPREKWP
jgi:hypothetical protein